MNIINNKFENLGHQGLQKQANAIRLGNSAFNYETDKTTGDFRISGNRIRNVFCGQYDGLEGYECHGIMVIGNRAHISGCQLENIYNGGIQGDARIRTGSEGIYVKGDDCSILDNTLINTGLCEGAVCVKGLNTGVVIRGNRISYTLDKADHSQLITCYYRETLRLAGRSFRVWPTIPLQSNSATRQTAGQRS